MTALTRPTLDLYDAWASCLDEFGPGHVDASATWLVPRERDTTIEFCADLVTAAGAMADSSVPAPEGLVHADTYWITDGDVVVGFLQLRHTLNAFLLEQGGHVGYSVRPSRRRRGHATRALALALERARSLGLGSVLVTCDEDNVASARTIESAGGELEDLRQGKRRYWIDLYAPLPSTDEASP